MALAAETRLGRYEIRAQLGAGGMGQVYLVRDKQLERTIALKILPADVASDRQTNANESSAGASEMWGWLEDNKSSDFWRREH